MCAREAQRRLIPLVMVNKITAMIINVILYRTINYEVKIHSGQFVDVKKPLLSSIIKNKIKKYVWMALKSPVANPNNTKKSSNINVVKKLIPFLCAREGKNK